MKENLIEILNALHRVETRGDSTLIMADCIRGLVQIINTMDKEDKDGVQ